MLNQHHEVVANVDLLGLTSVQHSHHLPGFSAEHRVHAEHIIVNRVEVAVQLTSFRGTAAALRGSVTIEDRLRREAGRRRRLIFCGI